MATTTERERQANLAQQRGGSVFAYDCADGYRFDAVAHTESGAFRVLNAERPHMPATLVGTIPLCSVCGYPRGYCDAIPM